MQKYGVRKNCDRFSDDDANDLLQESKSQDTLFYLESHIVHDNIGDFIIKLVHT